MPVKHAIFQAINNGQGHYPSHNHPYGMAGVGKNI